MGSDPISWQKVPDLQGLHMKLSSYFIDRPVFASVLSAFILITGAIALFKLPVSEYPEVVPPSVVVRAAYPGANPKVIAETVAAPLEQEIVGVENMLYMSSQATMDGSLALGSRCLSANRQSQMNRSLLSTM